MIEIAKPDALARRLAGLSVWTKNRLLRFEDAFGRFAERGPRYEALFVVLLATATLVLRFPELSFNPSLWGEDIIIMRQAHDFGAAYIFQSIVGYLFVLPKIIAVSTTLIPLRYGEIVFHLAAIAAVYICFFAIWFHSPLPGWLPRTVACVALLCVPINPSSLYVCLINTQWLFGAILPLLLLSLSTGSSRFAYGWLALIGVTCLTGPFCVLSLPALAARASVRRDLRREWVLYATVSAATLLQTIVLFTSGRGRLHQPASPSLEGWYEGLVQNTLFRLFPHPLLIVPFALFLVLLARHAVLRLDRSRQIEILALLAVSGASCAAGFYVLKDKPELVGPFLAGERYFLIPLFLLYVALLLSAARSALLVSTTTLFIVLSCAGGVFVGAAAERGPGYWLSYIDYTRYAGDVGVVTRPYWQDEVFKWSFHNPSPEIAPVDRPLAASDVTLRGLAAQKTGDEPSGRWLFRRIVEPNLLADATSPSAPRWTSRNVTLEPLGSEAEPGGPFRVTISKPRDHKLSLSLALPRPMKTHLRLRLEVRADKPMRILSPLSGGRAQPSFGVAITREWTRIDRVVRIHDEGLSRIEMILLEGGPHVGTIEVRALEVTFEDEPQMLISIPKECSRSGSAALTYRVVGGADLLHRFDTLSGEAETFSFQHWYSQFRWSKPGHTMVFAVPVGNRRTVVLSQMFDQELSDLRLLCY